jgi:hypothetical protein
MNLQNSGTACRENSDAYPPVMPAQAGIQYSETLTMESRIRGVLDTRRSLSSGAHSRDPVAGMTADRVADAFYTIAARGYGSRLKAGTTKVKASGPALPGVSGDTSHSIFGMVPTPRTR